MKHMEQAAKMVFTGALALVGVFTLLVIIPTVQPHEHIERSTIEVIQ